MLLFALPIVRVRNGRGERAVRMQQLPIVRRRRTDGAERGADPNVSARNCAPSADRACDVDAGADDACRSVQWRFEPPDVAVYREQADGADAGSVVTGTGAIERRNAEEQ